MRRTLAFFILAALAGPAGAVESGRKPLVDFAAYSIFIVANDNCGNLHFDAEKLRLGMDRFANSLNWGEKKRRLQARAMVSDNQKKFEADPQAFCASAQKIVGTYDKDGIRY
ncbi:hypothetical protein [Rhizobium sp. SL86]|jgi:hypothetical protein|uniref:hypothetical protein n=1 Tax=Rhizobium sp. SL86 TaxID=2995148 RepID=UPI002273950E|nr:hypothetical protein [Rhizobium sp. SL86]MCY1668045.1 hypothetical protein [Rhizobium sp. SL86]